VPDVASIEFDGLCIFTLSCAFETGLFQKNLIFLLKIIIIIIIILYVLNYFDVLILKIFFKK